MGGYPIYRQNARVLEMQNFNRAYMKGGNVCTYSVRTILSEPKFLGCIDNQIFLPTVLLCARFARERARLITVNLDVSIQNLRERAPLEATISPLIYSVWV